MKSKNIFGIVPSIILLLLILSVAYSWQSGSDYKIEMSIPFNANRNLGQSNLIKKIAYEIRLYPHAEIYVVFQPGNQRYAGSRLTYDRKKRRLTYKDVMPMENGWVSWKNNVTDAAIAKAAKDSAQFNDMEKYGCNNMLE
jgi:hypothetical protein